MQASSQKASTLLSIEPDDEWKEVLKRHIEAGLHSMVDEVKQKFSEELGKGHIGAEEQERLTAEHLATLTNLRQLAEEQFRIALERERQERRWAGDEKLDRAWSESMMKEQQAILDGIERERKNKTVTPLSASTASMELLKAATPQSSLHFSSTPRIPCKARPVQEFWKPSITPEESTITQGKSDLGATPPRSRMHTIATGNEGNGGNETDAGTTASSPRSGRRGPKNNSVAGKYANEAHSLYPLDPLLHETMLAHRSSVASTVIKSPSILGVDPLETPLSEGHGNVDHEQASIHFPNQDSSEDGSHDSIDDMKWWSQEYIEQHIYTIEEWMRKGEKERMRMEVDLAMEVEELKQQGEVRKKRVGEWKREFPSEPKQGDRDEIERKEMELLRRVEEVDRKEMEATRLIEEARRKEEEATRKELEAKWRELETRQKEEEVRKMDEQARRKEEEVQRRTEEATRRAEETRKKEEELRKREEELRCREEDLNRRVAEMRRYQEQSAKEETLRHQSAEEWMVKDRLVSKHLVRASDVAMQLEKERLERLEKERLRERGLHMYHK